MDRLEAMSLLIDVVDSGSFSATARRLHMPLTTVARKVSDLEASLGVKLLVRSTRKLDLTDAGMRYVKAARRIVEQVVDAEREAMGEFTIPKGELVITAPVQFGQIHVLPIVADFLAQFPKIDIRLRLQDRNMHLVEDHVDMAVRIGNLPDSTMIATRVGSMRTVICGSPQLLAKHGMPQTVEDLQAMPCVAYDGPSPAAGWWLIDPLTKAEIPVPIRPRLIVSTVEAAVQATLQHVGITRLLFYQVAEAVRAGRLELLLPAFEPEPLPVSLVHAERGQMPLKMRCFLDFAAPRLRSALAGLRSVEGTRE